MDANHVTEPHAEDVILAGRWRSNALLLPDQIHGVNEHGKATLRKQLKRDQMASFFATLALLVSLAWKHVADGGNWPTSAPRLELDVRLV